MGFMMIDDKGNKLGKMGDYTSIGSIRVGDIVVVTNTTNSNKIHVDLITKVQGKAFFGELSRSIASVAIDDDYNVFRLIPYNEVTEELINRFSSIECIRVVEYHDKHMTLEDIEKELGYSIKLID